MSSGFGDSTTRSKERVFSVDSKGFFFSAVWSSLFRIHKSLVEFGNWLSLMGSGKSVKTSDLAMRSGFRAFDYEI